MDKIHYLTIEEIITKFGKHLTKKECKLLTVDTTITIDNDQITIIRNPKFSKTDISYE